MRTGKAGLSLLLLSIAGAAFGQTRYISDELIVPLRTGPSIRNAITRNLPAGTAVEIMEQQQDSGYSRVRLVDRDLDGWLETQYLSEQPIARDRLAAAERSLAAARTRTTELEAELAQVSAELDRTREELDAVRASSGALGEELRDVRRASADVLAIRSHNEELERGLRARESELEALRLENGALANRERQNWFVVGAAVLTGGIVLGLVLPSLRRRRREW